MYVDMSENKVCAENWKYSLFIGKICSCAAYFRSLSPHIYSCSCMRYLCVPSWMCDIKEHFLKTSLCAKWNGPSSCCNMYLLHIYPYIYLCNIVNKGQCTKCFWVCHCWHHTLWVLDNSIPRIERFENQSISKVGSSKWNYDLPYFLIAESHTYRHMYIYTQKRICS